MTLRQPVAENAIHRPGHQPFTHTIADVLNELAKRSVKDAWVRDDLEKMRSKRRRNGVK